MQAQLEVSPRSVATSADAGSDRSRIPELDGLRGIAILLVITKHYGLSHLPGEAGSSVVAFFNNFYPYLSGVDLFFVLSGFLLGSHLLRERSSPRYYSSFYLRRFCRTVPLYYLLLGCFTAAVLAADGLGSSLGLDLEWPFGTPWSLAAYALFVQNFWIAATGSLGPAWLGITWSLAVQEQFYLPLPWLLRWPRRRGLGWLLAGLIVLAPLSRLIVVRTLPESAWNGYDCLLWCRTDTLGAGVLAAWLLQGGGVRAWLASVRTLLVPAAAVLLGGFAVWTNAGHDVVGTASLFVLGHTYLAVLYVVLVWIACFASQGLTGVLLRTAVLRELGRISYGVFLLHEMVNDLFFRVVLGVPPQLDGWETWLATLESFVVTVLLAELSWHLLEKPLIDWSKPRRP